VRKPQRLRWGRSVPQFDTNSADNEQVIVINFIKGRLFLKIFLG